MFTSAWIPPCAIVPRMRWTTSRLVRFPRYPFEEVAHVASSSLPISARPMPTLIHNVRHLDPSRVPPDPRCPRCRPRPITTRSPGFSPRVYNVALLVNAPSTWIQLRTVQHFESLTNQELIEVDKINNKSIQINIITRTFFLPTIWSEPLL